MKYNLQNDDILYFLHIPKTAGTSLIFLLENHFNTENIFKAQSWNQLVEGLAQGFSKIQLVKGHYGYALHQLLPKKPIYITMLRNPQDVIISYLRMMKRQPETANSWNISKNDSISDLILRKDLTRVQNPLCHWLNFDLDMMSLTNKFDPLHFKKFFPPDLPDFLSPTLSDEEILARAKEHLLECKFFGIVERFEHSLMLLHYIFGWKPYRRSTKLNITPNENLEELSSEAKDELVNKTNLDVKLYTFAKQLFDDRFSQMIECLQAKYLNTNSKMQTADIIYELLEKDYKEYFLNSQEPSSTIHYTFDQKINGFGWHQREVNPLNNNFFRWTGPETVSTIDFLVRNHNDLKIQFHVLNSMSPNNLDNIQLKVNESFCILNFSNDALYKKGGYFETVLPKSSLNNNENFCRLTFQVNRTISPNSINPNSTDMRKLGIAIDWIKII